MNGADTPAVRLAEAKPKAINSGAMNTPPPTPLNPERKPAPAPRIPVDAA